MKNSYRLKDLKDRTTDELIWFYNHCYPQMLNRKIKACKILISRGVDIIKIEETR